MYDIKVDARELSDFGRVLARSGPPMRRDLETDVMQTSAFAQGIAREASPVFRGILANSIQVEPLLVIDGGAGLRIEGGIATSTPYAVVQDEGRRPGAPMPPLAAIRRWVELKVRRGDMFLEGDSQSVSTRRRSRRSNAAGKISGLAFVIARSIARKGIVGKKFMEKAAAVAEIQLIARTRATINRWAERLGG